MLSDAVLMKCKDGGGRERMVAWNQEELWPLDAHDQQPPASSLHHYQVVPCFYRYPNWPTVQ